ncbi:MAG: metal dependent phosphohydrolase [Bacillota bacterium]|nr:metal dependent phosphohydrolase [Bacillota bacterium]
MENNKNIFINIVKNRLLILLSLIIFLVFILILIFALTIHYNGEKDDLYNALSEQHMLIQKITKDANRKQVILSALTYGHGVKPDEILNERLNIINEKLKSNKLAFENKIKLLKLDNDNSYYSNKLINLFKPGLIIDTEKYVDDFKWTEFSEEVDIIIYNNEKNYESEKAIEFINTHSDQLANNWNNVSVKIMDIHKYSTNINLSIMIIIFIIIVLTLFIAIFQLNKYLVGPLSLLYIGLNNYNLISYKTKNNSKLSNKNDLSLVVNEIKSRFDKLAKLIELIENLNKDVSFEGILKYIHSSFYDFIPYSHIGVALLHDDCETLEASYGISDHTIEDISVKMVGLKVNINNTSLIKVVESGIPRVINDLNKYVNNNGRQNYYNKIFIEAGIKSSITLPLIINGKTVGIIFFSSVHKNIYKTEHIKFLETLSSSIALSFNKNIFIDELLYSTLIALVKMSEARDEDTGDHLDRMKKYSIKIAELLLEDGIYENEITVRFLKDIERFSPMHDIGKVGVKDGILLKPGKLSLEEFEIMKKHAVYGGEILRAAECNINKQNHSMFKMGIEIAEGHHEKWNGTGYPNKKSGYDIPLSARIVAVGDVFDALTSKRPYKEAINFEESFNYIVEGRGIHFDPNIVDCFIRHKSEIFQLYSDNQKYITKNVHAS